MLPPCAIKDKIQLIAEMLWHSDVYMSKWGRNHVEYTSALNLLRQHFEKYAISERLTNLSHSKLAQTLTSRLAKICSKLIYCGFVYRQLYEQPTVDLMNYNSHLFYVISFYTDKTMMWENEIHVKIKSATVYSFESINKSWWGVGNPGYAAQVAH